MLESSKYTGLKTIGTLNPVVCMEIIVPIIMFETAFFINQETLKISCIQITVLVLLNFGLALGFIGIVSTRLFDYGWDWTHAVILCSVVTMPGPILGRAFLKRLSSPFKLQLFLELEALIGNCVAIIIFKYTILIHVVKDSSAISGFLLSLLVAPILGLIASKLVAFWIRRIVKDCANQICIVVASVYFCFIFAQYLNISGILAICTMGISLAGKRSILGEGTEKFLTRFLHVISTFFNSNLIMVCGLQAQGLMFKVTWADIINIVIVFFILNLVRVCVILMLSPLMMYTGNCLSWRSIMTVCLCNIRGAVTILLSLCLLNQKFEISNPEKMYIVVLGQIVLSFLVNSTMTNIVIRYDVLAEQKESKYWIFQRTLAMLDNLRLYTITMFKHHHKFIADADWQVVEKFTQLQHPLFTPPKYRAVQLIGEKQKNQQNDNVDKQAIERILTMMKCSYFKQFEEGLMSRHSIKGTLSWSRQALVKGNSLIFPTKIASVLTVPHYYQKMRRELWSKLSEQIFLRNRAKTLSSFLRVFVICLHYLDVTLSMVHLTDEMFLVNTIPRSVFIWYNVTYIAIHLLIFIIKYGLTRKMSIWEGIILIIIPVGIADILAMSILSSAKPLFSVIRTTFILSRFLRILQVGEVCPAWIKVLLELCEKGVSKILSEGYEVGCGYIRGRQEVMRYLDYIQMDIPADILHKYKLICKQHKLETIRLLGFLQIQHPTVTRSAKTRQAARIILKSQLKKLRKHIHEKDVSGQDGTALEKKILLKLNRLSGSHHLVYPATNNQIIHNIPWIKESTDLFHFILGRGKLIQYKPGDIMLTQFQLAGGIYIILDGIAMVEKHYKEDVIRKVTCDYLTSGSVVGEYSFLTGKPRHKTVTCKTQVLVFYIRSIYLWKYIKELPEYKGENFSLLEMKMWRVVAIRLAFRILLNEPTWFKLSYSQIVLELSEATLLFDCDDNSLFRHICNSDVIVIQGSLFYGGTIVPGPFFIQHGNTSFSFVEKEKAVILVLPAQDEEQGSSCLGSHLQCHDILEGVHQVTSDLTLSSGSSNERPTFQPRKRYFLYTERENSSLERPNESNVSILCSSQYESQV
ncbi:sodium/hydrogen exchanger 10-like isoform X2 [Physella acuta]|nr:sodium/hydrogen exchanger 10-like isoform X2 [Physella acuta]